MERTDTEHGVAADTPVAQRPLVRQLAEWRLFVPFAGRVLALQGSHPTVAKGIYDHSEIFSDPWRRAERTFTYAQRIMFGPDQAGTAAEVRELHRDIKGTGFDGRPYHAWNREAWTWVHLSTFEATLFALRRIHGRLPQDELQGLYEEARRVGVLYGVRDQDMPVDVAGLLAYIRQGVVERLTHRPQVDLVETLRTIPRPRGVPVPARLWALSLVPTSHAAHIALAGSFPPIIRHRWGIRWTGAHELEYRAQLQALRRAISPLPERLRLLPYPYHVLRQPA